MVKRIGKAPIPRPSIAPCTALALALLLGSPGSGLGPAAAQEPESFPIDRWLVATGFESAEAADRTMEGLAAAVREEAFPERLREAAGARWELVREDGSRRIVPQGAEGPVVVGHAFLRSPEDRSVRLVWEAPACGGVDLRLNGQPIRSGVDSPRAAASESDERGGSAGAGHGGVALVRLARGWNTLAARVSADGCPPALAVGLLSGPREGDEGPPSLSGLRVQGSRPPGVHRTLPDPWVTVGAPMPVGLAWPAEADDLAAELSVSLRAWGAPPGGLPGRAEAAGEERDPAEERETAERDTAEEREEAEERPRRTPRGPGADPERTASPDPEERRRLIRERLRPPIPAYDPAPRTVRVEGRAAGARWRTTARLAGPARATAVSLPLSFEDLRRAAGEQPSVRLDVRYDGARRRVERALDPAAVRALLEGPIALTGAALPGAAGERWAGTWRVPAALGGATLELVTADAPGDYRVDGRPLSAEDDGTLALCADCRAGAELAIEATSAADWSRPPAVQIVESAPASEP